MNDLERRIARQEGLIEHLRGEIHSMGAHMAYKHELIDNLRVAIATAKQNMDFGQHETAHEILRTALTAGKRDD